MIFDIKREYRYKSGIYAIRNLIDNKRLIGSTSSLYTRFDNYRRKDRRRTTNNIYLKSAIEKYGTDNFIFELVCLCDKENLLDFEDYYCKFFNTYAFFPYNGTNGYNLKTASRHPEFSKEIKEIMSNKAKGNSSHLGHKHSEETKEYISRTQLGKMLTDETKNKIREGNKGKIVSEHTRKLLSDLQTGRKRSEETKIKISQSKLGKKWSQNRYLKCGIKVAAYNKDGSIFKIFNSISEATRYFTNGKQHKCPNISRSMSKPTYTAYGYYWKII